MVASDGLGEYDVAFEALAGTAAGHLSAGHVAYITTGSGLGMQKPFSDGHNFIACLVANAVLRDMQAHRCPRELTPSSRSKIQTSCRVGAWARSECSS